MLFHFLRRSYRIKPKWHGETIVTQGPSGMFKNSLSLLYAPTISISYKEAFDQHRLCRTASCALVRGRLGLAFLRARILPQMEGSAPIWC